MRAVGVHLWLCFWVACRHQALEPVQLQQQAMQLDHVCCQQQAQVQQQEDACRTRQGRVGQGGAGARQVRMRRRALAWRTEPASGTHEESC